MIIFIDANESFIPGNINIPSLASHHQMLDPIVARHRVDLESLTHKRGSKQIDFFFCTQLINQYTQQYGILPFDTLSPSDYYVIYIDLKIYNFLKDKVHLPTPPIKTHSSKALDSVNTYTKI